MPSMEPNERPYILNLQRYLRQLSVIEQDLPAPPLDGIYDTATEEAVRAFQELRGLPVTGRVDQETWTRIYFDYLAALESTAQAEGLYIFPDLPIDYAAYPDEEHFLILVIQYLLNELRLAYDDIPQNEQNGQYDAATRQGIFAFQRRQQLPQEDRVDRATWNALVREHQRILTKGIQ